uniref:Tc1-like transposase DDE domain-containing protein n=1 Tax=Desulfomonile tiedjei TaxID=2358 RepID=A0A7C4EUU5_9BACT
MFLPPYSPDLNPIERLWLILKAQAFSRFYAKSLDELIDRLTRGLRWLIERKD